MESLLGGALFLVFVACHGLALMAAHPETMMRHPSRFRY